MVSSITSVSSTSASSSYDPLQAADRVLEAMLNSDEMLEFLADHTSTYIPLSSGLIISGLWGHLNTSGSSTLTKADVQHAVFADGAGGTNDASSFWKQLNPEQNSTVAAGDFARSIYLNGTIFSMLESLEEAVAEVRREKQSTSGSGSLLDFFSAHSGTILDFFA